MPFDPFGLEEYHAKVREKIAGREPGWAQSQIGRVLVSYRRGRGFTGAHGLGDPRNDPFLHDVLDEMLIDVARGEGIASPATFDRDYVERAIEDRRLFPDHWTKKHRQADLLESFYINGAGAELLAG